jgi:radical SAM protein with 4Fe4S-binding SPASM domain
MDCPEFPDLDYGDFSANLRRKLADQRLPLNGSLELTLRCNLRCRHCYVSYGHNGVAGLQELSLPHIQRILDEVTDAGCLWFLLTGGEPLVRRDFSDIYLYARRKGLLLTLYTNGTLLTPPIADFLAEWRPLLIEISLYGRSQETYERITGIPGSHARCLRGIELLLERGLPLRLKTSVLTLNRGELKDMQAFAQSLGVGFRTDPMINLGLPGGWTRPEGLRLTAQEVVQCELEDPLRRKAWSEYFAKTPRQELSPEQLYTCNAGWHSFHIDPYGQLSLCMMDRQPAYDLKSGSFADGWYNFLAKLRSLPMSAGHPCRNCELRSTCPQCPGWGQVEYGDRQKRVPFLCQVSRLRSEALGFQKGPEKTWVKVQAP